MEWIIQAALAAIISELVLGKKLGNRALAWGALIGLMPQFDLLISVFLDNAHQLAWHHGPSHSLILMALASCAVGHGLAKIWKRKNIGKLEAIGVVFLIWSSNLLVYIFSSPGVDLWWPFSSNRVTLGLLNPCDFFFAIPLVLTALWVAFLPVQIQSKARAKNKIPVSPRRRCCYWGLGIAVSYLLVGAGMKWLVSSGFQADLVRRGTKYQRRFESPTFSNLLLWRAVVDRGSEIWVGYRSVFELPSTPVRWTIYPRGSENLASVAEMRETKSLIKFTDGWWIARANAKGAWLGDIRTPESRTWVSKKNSVDSRLSDSWLIFLSAKGDSLRPISPSEQVTDKNLRRMSARIFGKHEAWEGTPRLTGVPGSLPEFLTVEE